MANSYFQTPTTPRLFVSYPMWLLSQQKKANKNQKMLSWATLSTDGSSEVSEEAKNNLIDLLE